MRDPELHCLMVNAAKAAPSLHILNQSFFVSTRSSSTSLLVGSFTTCVKKLSSDISYLTLVTELQCTLYNLSVCLILGCPELDTVLHLLCHKSCPSTCCPDSETAQDVVGLLYLKDTLLTHVQVDVHQDSKADSQKTAFCPVSSQPVLLHRVIPPQLQEFIFAFLELHDVSVGSFLQTTVWLVHPSSPYLFNL